MDELRLILIIVGVAIVAGVYFWGSRGISERSRRESPSSRPAASVPPVADSVIEPVDPIDRARDEHAARNARALVGLEDFDIDSDADVVVRPRDESEPSNQEIEEEVAPEPQEPQGFFGDDPAHGPTRDPQLSDAATPAMSAGEDDGAPPMMRVKARRSEPRQLDLDGLAMSAEPRSGTSEPSTKISQDSDAQDEPEPHSDEPGFPVAVTLMAGASKKFVGNELRDAFEAEELRFGEQQLYHRYQPGQAVRSGPQFSVVNAVKPGVFNPDELAGIETPGLVIFMDASAVKEPTAVFDEMLSTAHRLAERLNGRVCDQNRSPMTTQAINHLRESVAEHARRRMLR